MEMKEYIREFSLKDIVLVRKPKVVAIGGGTGLSTTLRGLKKYTENLTAIVSMGDDGGSSGVLRKDLGIAPPGDIRNCILALADDENIMQALFNYRFEEGGLEGHSFGNLFLAAMDGISMDFYDAVKRTADVLQITGCVLPVTLDEMTLVATLEDGTIVEGESKIPKIVSCRQSRIKELALKNKKVCALEETIMAIKAADLIILGPGSLYTSLLPNLLVNGIQEAIEGSTAKKYCIGNLMTQRGETDGYSLDDHLEAVRRHQINKKAPIFNRIITNTGSYPRDVLMRYKDFGAESIKASDPREDYLYIYDDFTKIENGKIRHNTDLLARRIFEDYLDAKKGLRP